MKWNPPSQIDMAMVGFALPLKGCTHPTTLFYIDLRFFVSAPSFSKTPIENYKCHGQIESVSWLA